MNYKLKFFFLGLFFVIFFGIGEKAYAASITLDPNNGVVGTDFTITGSEFTPNLSVSVVWDSSELSVSSSEANREGSYSATSQVPSDASVGTHTIRVTSAVLMYQPNKTWLNFLISKALAITNPSSTATFTVTAPPSPSSTPSSSPTSTPTPTPSETLTPSDSPSPTPSDSNTDASSEEQDVDTTPSASSTPSASPTPSATLSQSSTPSPTFTSTVKNTNQNLKISWYLSWWFKIIIVIFILLILAGLALILYLKRKKEINKRNIHVLKP